MAVDVLINFDTLLPLCTGAPSTPSLQYLVINDETLEVSWDEPHTPVNHSVTSYYIMVTDTYQLPIQLLYEQLDPDIRSINVTQEDPNSCSNLTMQVWAENSLGNGSIGETYGAFPAGKLTLCSRLTESQGGSPSPIKPGPVGDCKYAMHYVVSS